MKQSILLLLVVVTLFFSGTTTHAVSIINTDPGTFGTIPGGATNELLSSIYGTSTRGGYYGSTVLLTKPAHVIFTFLGFEAGYDNDFNLAGFDELFSTEDYHPDNTVIGISIQKGPFYLPDGIIPFSFDINNDFGMVANGSNPDDAAGTGDINFFLSFDHDPSATNGTSLVLFLDDSGAGPDDNHDDFAVRIQVQAIPNPEPSTMLLFGAGLIGLAGFGRRFKRS